jgi:hypothetical protein
MGYVFLAGALSAASASCTRKANVAATADAGSPDSGSNTPASEGTEWVNYHTQIPLAASDFDPLASGLFGAAAQAGQFINQKELSQSFYVSSQAESATPNQTRLAFTFDDGSGTPRTLAVTPASFAMGQVFITAVDAAMAQMAADVDAGNAGGEIFNLAYQVTSSEGGTLSFAVAGSQGTYSLVVDITTPHTSLGAGVVGMAASDAAPSDTVAGTVWFGMTQDEFDYFVSHAYGQGATAGQNFSDFALVPYNWLRLTVTPDIADDLVNVAFVVKTPDGGMIPFAKAPASVMAGNTFQTLVDRSMTNMTAQEANKAGSSTPWQIPFYYDQPAGGGVVQVIASGSLGNFTVAYSVAAPQHPLVDVPFVPYKAVTFPDAGSTATTPCYQLGNPSYVQALQGVFQITFTASSVITSNLKSGQTLTGDIGCSIFHLSDVTVTGPNPGAVSLEDFTVPAANLLASTPPTFTTTTSLPDGQYQILCAQYIVPVSGDAGMDSQVQAGDPVTLPIGGYTLACNVNPVTVEFAILDPQNN